jgi:hypothetical protein
MFQTEEMCRRRQKSRPTRDPYSLVHKAEEQFRPQPQDLDYIQQ